MNTVEDYLKAPLCWARQAAGVTASAQRPTVCMLCRAAGKGTGGGEIQVSVQALPSLCSSALSLVHTISVISPFAKLLPAVLPKSSSQCFALAFFLQCFFSTCLLNVFLFLLQLYVHTSHSVSPLLIWRLWSVLIWNTVFKQKSVHVVQRCHSLKVKWSRYKLLRTSQ